MKQAKIYSKVNGEWKEYSTDEYKQKLSDDKQTEKIVNDLNKIFNKGE